MFGFFKKKNPPVHSKPASAYDKMTYPEVPDWNPGSAQLTAFRAAYNDFFSKSGMVENAPIQQYATQLYWHTLALQKKRLDRLGLTLHVETKRVQRKKDSEESLSEDAFFDGHYEICQVNEDLFAKRTFKRDEEPVGVFVETDSANYTVVSAKTQGDATIICPNCGNPSDRENLIDGCDYCGTKFSIEDLNDRIGGFELQFDLLDRKDNEKLRETHKILDEQSAYMARKVDPYFSMGVFSESVYNKFAAIHYADTATQVNAFSDVDLQGLFEEFKNVVNTDLWHIRINEYKVEDGMQKVRIKASLVLFELIDGKIKLRNEVLNAWLEKSADCMSQVPCGPATLKCDNCGASLLLIEGKTCHYCDTELDMKQHDWVITSYDTGFGDYGRSLRET